jgi:DNA-binding NarL/FixJ family response regulator
MTVLTRNTAGDAALSRRPSDPIARILASLPPLPLEQEHWRRVAKTMRLSRQHAKIVELILRTATPKQIAIVLKIADSTLKTYMQRIFAKTGTRCRVQLVIHVMVIANREPPAASAVLR